MSLAPIAFGPIVNLPGILVAQVALEFRAPLGDIKKFEGQSIGFGKFKGECAAGVQWALRQNNERTNWRGPPRVRGLSRSSSSG